MNRFHLAFTSILCLFLVAGVVLTSLGTASDQNEDGPPSLGVPLRSQMASELCWAACTEMVSMYYNSLTGGAAPVITQCMEVQIAGDSIPLISCDTITANNIPNFPLTPFAMYHTYKSCWGYTPTQYSCHDCVGAAMSWDTLSSYIRNGTPVVFGWSYQGITIKAIDSVGAHYMVAEGTPRSSYISHGWISVKDPWPVGKGLHRVMAYSEYANQFPPSIAGNKRKVFSEHYNDWYVSQYPGQKQ
jgi:hypothetical protein